MLFQTLLFVCFLTVTNSVELGLSCGRIPFFPSLQAPAFVETNSKMIDEEKYERDDIYIADETQTDVLFLLGALLHHYRKSLHQELQ